MNKLTTLALLAASGLLAGCSDMPLRSSFTSGGTATGMTSSGSSGTAGTGAGNWYNGRQDISRNMYFGG